MKKFSRHLRKKRKRAERKQKAGRKMHKHEVDSIRIQMWYESTALEKFFLFFKNSFYRWHFFWSLLGAK